MDAKTRDEEAKKNQSSDKKKEPSILESLKQKREAVIDALHSKKK